MKKIEGIEANEFGLYSYEVLLMSYALNYYVDSDNKYPGFWWYRYGIKDLNKCLDSLMEGGFIKRGSLKSAIKKQKNSVLKEILRENNNKVLENKENLLAHLLILG